MSSLAVERGLVKSLVASTLCTEQTQAAQVISTAYELILSSGSSETTVDLNQLVGVKLRLDDLQDKECLSCGRKKISKTFGPGYCFPCFRSRPETDLCIVKPERCHFAQGTCRDPQWGQQHCMQQHSIYLAFSSQLKVGLSRSYRLHQRWMDQGALGGVEIAQVDTRLKAGQVEVFMKQFYKDITQPKKMLTFAASPDNYELVAQALGAEKITAQRCLHQGGYGDYLRDSPMTLVKYPAPQAGSPPPAELKLVSFVKQAAIEGVLTGIKGQYLIFDERYAFSVRKHLGHYLKFSVL